MKLSVLCFAESQLTPCNQTLACTAASKLTCTLPNPQFHSAAKQLVCPLHLLDNLNIKLSCEERYKQSINITASQHTITANDILVKYSNKLI